MLPTGDSREEAVASDGVASPTTRRVRSLTSTEINSRKMGGGLTETRRRYCLRAISYIISSNSSSRVWRPWVEGRT